MVVIVKLFEIYVYLRILGGKSLFPKEVGFSLGNNHVLKKNELFSPRTWLLLKET
jgi:hypothetical protein